MAPSLRRLAGLLVIAASFGCPKAVDAPQVVVPDIGTGVQIGQVVRLDASGSTDPQGRELSFAWQFDAIPVGSHAALNDAHSATPSFLADVDGEYDVQVVVSNAFVSAAAVVKKIAVSKCGGRAPVFGGAGITAKDAARPTVTGNFAVGSTIVLASDVSDPDDSTTDQVCTASQNQALSYQWKLIGQPAASTASLNNATASAPSFVADVAGTYTVRLVATDSTGRSSTPFDQTFTVSTCGANAPTIASVAPVSERLAVGTNIQLSPLPDDADNGTACQAVLGAPQTFSFKWSLPQMPNGSHAQLNSTVAQSPSFDPDVDGEYVVRLVVTDSSGLSSDPKDTSIKVPKCGNNAPVASITAADGSAAPSSGFLGVLLQFGEQVQDLDQEAIGATPAACNPILPQSFTSKWSIVALPAGSTAQLNSAGATNPSFTPDVAGTYTVQLVVTDQSGLSSAPATQSVLVAACGLTPPAIGGLGTTSGATVFNAGSLVGVTATASDPDNSCGLPKAQTFTYAWSLVSRPAGSAAFIVNPAQDPTAGPATFTPDVANGTYQVQLVVTDSTGLKSAPAFFSVFTNSCGTNAPAIGSAAADVTSPNTGTLVTLTAQGADPDNAGGGKCSPALAQDQKLSFRWTLLSRPSGSGAALTVATADGSGASFTPDVIGSYQFSVVVTDSTGLSSAPSFVTVQTSQCGAHAPVIASVAASSTPNPPRPTLDTVALSGVVTDADDSCISGGQPRTYAWTVSSRPAGSSAVIASPTSLGGASFVPDVPGAYQFRLDATDALGLKAAPAFATITADACSTVGPVVSAFPPGTATQFAGVALPAPAVTNGNCLPAASVNTYSWAVVQAPAGSAAILGNPSADSPAFTPDKTGSYQFAVVVTNGVGISSAPAYFNLQVSSCGTLPLSWASIGVTSVADPELGSVAGAPSTGARVTVNAQATSNNVLCGTHVEPISYRWALVQAPAGSHAALTSVTDPSPAFVPDVTGTYQLSVVATDALGNTSASPNFLTVTTTRCGANVPQATISPSLLTGANAIFSLAPQNVSALVSNADDSCAPRFHVAAGAYTYAWSIVAQPLGGSAALSGAASPTATFQASTAGRYSLHVVATTPAGISSDASFAPSFVDIDVKSCGSNAPVVNSVSTFASGTTSPLSRPAVGQAVDLVAFATDADEVACGVPLAHVASYTWTAVSLPSGSTAPFTFTASVGTFTVTPDVAGTFTYDVVATDDTGLSSAPVRVSLETATCGPVVGAIRASDGSAFLTADSSNSVSSLRGTALSFDASPAPTDACIRSPSFAYSWSLSRPSSSAATLSTVSGTNPSFTPDVAGTYQVQLVVTDNAGLSSAPATLTVNAANCGGLTPSVGALVSAPAAPNAGQMVQLSAPNIADGNTCGSLPVTPYAYNWTILSRPQGSSAVLSSQTAASPVFVADVPNGTWQVALTVTDQIGMSSAPQFLTVISTNCGALPPTVALVPGSSVADFRLTQNLSVNGGAPLNLVHASNPAFNQASGAGTTLVPFYPAVPVQLDANVNAGADACAPTKTVSYDWAIIAQPAGSTAKLNNPAAASPSFTPDLPGTYDFRLVLTDQNGFSSTNTLALDAALGHPGVVSVCGTHAPILVALVAGPIPAPASGVPNEPLGVATQLDATGSQSPDDYRFSPYPIGCGLTRDLSYHWELTAAPVGSTAQIVSPALIDPSFVPDQPGTYKAQVTATDGVNSATRTVSLNGVGGFTSAPPVTSVAPATSGQVFTATAVDGSGNPVVAWWDNTNGTVAAARCTGNCATSNPNWTSLGTVDSGLGLMTFAPADEPRPIAVAVSGTNTYVAYFTSNGAATTTGAHGASTCGVAMAVHNGTTWTSWTSIPNAPGVPGSIFCTAGGAPPYISYELGRWLSMAVRGGVPVVSFWAVVGPNMTEPEISSCTDVTCTAFVTQTVEVTLAAATRLGRWNSLAVDAAGALDLAYFVDDDGTGLKGLRFATNASGTFAATNADVSATGDVGRFAAIAAVPGSTPAIAYRDATNAVARFVRCSGSSCGTPQQILDPASTDYGIGNALTVDANGSLRLAYFDATNHLIRVLASKDGSAFSKTAEIATFASTADAPVGLSLAIGSGTNLAYSKSATGPVGFFAGP